MAISTQSSEPRTPIASRRTTLTIVIILSILLSLGVGVWLVYLAVGAIAKIAGVITAAIIGLVGTLITAVLNHANQLDAQRKQAAFMAKQENYKELLSKVGTFARNEKNDPEAGDALSSAHLASWAFGDRKVLESTNKFQQRPDTETLVTLLEAVRDSLGYKDDLPEDFTRDPNRYDPKVLFPGGDKPVGGLQPPPELPSKEIALQAQQEQIQAQQEQLAQLQAQLGHLLSGQAHQASRETGVSGSQGQQPQTGRNEGVTLKIREVAKREHTRSDSDTQTRRSTPVEASEDTETRESSEPGNSAKPDIRHTDEKEKPESTSDPWWKFW
jgi:hypothetical protein